jgi:hypothetical protein
MKVLLIAYKYPPIKAISSMRAYNLAREFVKKSHTVYVSTTSNRHVMNQEKQEPVGEIIYEIKTWDYRNWNIFKKRKSNQKAYYNSKVGKLSIRIINSFPFNILVGEGGILYILNSYRKGSNLIQNEKVDLIFSSFRPYADHFIAFLLKKRYPGISWIADFRDPHVDPMYKNTFANGFQHWCNKKILSKADLVTAVSDGIVSLFKRYNNNVYTLTNGFGRKKQDKTESEQFQKFTIAYTGSMFANERKPDRMLETISNLLADGTLDSSKLEVIYAGPHSAYWQDIIGQYGLNSVFKDHGNISMHAAEKIQQNSHINLLLTSSHKDVSGIFTGKLFEYLAAQRPIVAIINGTHDKEYESLFREVNAGLLIYHQENTHKLETFLKDNYLHWEKYGKEKHEMNKDKLISYTWDSIFRRFYNALLNKKIISTS